MSARRTEMHRLQELVRLHRRGEDCREVARLLGMGPNTERRYRTALSQAGLLEGSAEEIPALEELKEAVKKHVPPKVAPQQQSSVERWRAYIAARVEEGLKPAAIYDRLRLEERDFSGSRSAVKRMVATLQREQGIRPQDIAIVVETDPGHVAQVDFGYAGRLWDPETKSLRRAWVFVMVLGYSRHLFAQIVFDQKTETWLRLHEEAFRAFGGVPSTMVPDNLKAAVVRAAFGVDEDSGLSRSYRELARHYGFTVDPTPPRAPQKKGKVEASVKYVKRNALAGREGQDVGEVRAALGRWIVEIAGTRQHGTTKRRPLEVFEAEEKSRLQPLPLRPYELVTWKRARVHRDCHVELGGRLYSVPWRLVEREVWLRATPSSVVVYADDEAVARHDRRGAGLRSTLDRHLPEERAALRHRSRAYWEQRADQMGQDVGRFVREVFDADDVLSQLRKVQAIVTHLEKFPKERAQAACRRASHYGNLSYQGVRDILRRGLDFEPSPQSAAPAAWAEAPPRFARDLRLLAASRLSSTGGDHGPH
ncbi:IS21 family transposase [Sorangium sp. So ce385]|uniref:IS21 family transposase n=1 Tax=Sorangium sp. So ce385 TaxID=3133308 RepID=UPI003F5C1485